MNHNANTQAISVLADHETPKAACRAAREEGLSLPSVFVGWSRDGFWTHDGKLLGRRGVIYEPAKLVRAKSVDQAIPSWEEHQAAQEAARRSVERLWASMPDFLTGTRHKQQERN